MKEKNDSILDTNDLGNLLKSEKQLFTRIFTQKNPNQYNGELTVNQDIKPNNTNKKKLFIED